LEEEVSVDDVVSLQSLFGILPIEKQEQSTAARSGQGQGLTLNMKYELFEHSHSAPCWEVVCSHSSYDSS
jgi:hypothetical protein